MSNDNNTYLLTDKTSNVYIEFQHLRHLNKYVSSRTRIYCSNISNKKENVMSYIKIVSQFNKELSKNPRPGYQQRNGYIFNIMLPVEFELSQAGSKNKIKKLCDDVVSSIDEGNELKYFATINYLGKSNTKMLHIVIPDRIYYPDGKTITYTSYGKERTEDIYISKTKIRLSHFATKTKMSSEIFKLKMYELKIKFLTVLEEKVTKVPFFFKKLSYKQIIHAKAINEYYYVSDILDQRDIVKELLKRRTTVVNLLITELNFLVATHGEIIPNKEAFKEKWNKYIQFIKKRKISELDALEEEVISKINGLKLLKI